MISIEGAAIELLCPRLIIFLPLVTICGEWIKLVLPTLAAYFRSSSATTEPPPTVDTSYCVLCLCSWLFGVVTSSLLVVLIDASSIFCLAVPNGTILRSKLSRKVDSFSNFWLSFGKIPVFALLKPSNSTLISSCFPTIESPPNDYTFYTLRAISLLVTCAILLRARNYEIPEGRFRC